ncbi:MAG: hypothetical protein NXH75_12590 [Halobacteriovoraceae bacterium]|nr:hypothetical protein [Halobacteriovoraceae bacterium]
MTTLSHLIKKVIVLLGLILLITSAKAASVNPEDLVAEYLGNESCGVRVEIYRGNQLKFSIVRAGFENIFDTVPFYKMETVSSDQDSFKFESEFFGRRGEETKIVQGQVKNGKLTSITLKKKRRIFAYESVSCRGLIPLAPYLF